MLGLLTSFLSLVLAIALPGLRSHADPVSLAHSQVPQFMVEHISTAAIRAAFGERTGHGLPARLRIPAIGVDAEVEYVGLTPDGSMDVPKDRDDVAWFQPGQRPGERGSAVIAGHYGTKGGSGSVFDDLHRLREGDEILVEDDEGATTTFIVRNSRRYDPVADTSGVFGSDDGKAHLNLITCEGVWDDALQSYPLRLVVFADRATE